jgi:DNA-directed RNA polymerase sigma subunit (sigma70/sigma32)
LEKIIKNCQIFLAELTKRKQEDLIDLTEKDVKKLIKMLAPQDSDRLRNIKITRDIKFVILLYGLDGEKMSTQEIAEIAGLSNTRVRDIKTQIFLKLRSPNKVYKFDVFFKKMPKKQSKSISTKI